MNIQELYSKSRKHYIHFLKYCNPNKPDLFDSAPSNLLELLDNAHKRMHKLKSML